MGKIKNNAVTKGFSGKLGDDITFRQVDGKTIFAKRTLTSTAPTEKQQQVRNRFSEASQFAAASIDNPQALLDYKAMAELQGLKSAYMAALIDYLTAPEMGIPSTAYYKGRIGDMINVAPTVPGKFTEVAVSILSADGAVLESGIAIERNLKWAYTATVVNAQWKGSRIVLVGRDRQDREATFEKVL
jgi:hypothetical protein